MIYIAYLIFAIMIGMFSEFSRNILSRKLETTKKEDKNRVEVFKKYTIFNITINSIIFLIMFSNIMNNPGKTSFLFSLSVIIQGYLVYLLGQTENILSTKEGKKEFLKEMNRQRVEQQKMYNKKQKFR